METINDYTIYCTPEQTKKALELGAPIDSIQHYASIGRNYTSGNNIYDDGKCYFIPTAEQMIGWLEEQGLCIEISIDNFGYEWAVWKRQNLQNVLFLIGNYNPSRKEATLAAIDASLEYLTNNKK